MQLPQDHLLESNKKILSACFRGIGKNLIAKYLENETNPRLIYAFFKAGFTLAFKELRNSIVVNDKKRIDECLLVLEKLVSTKLIGSLQ